MLFSWLNDVIKQNPFKISFSEIEKYWCKIFKYIGNLAHVKFICPLNFPHWPQNGLPFHYFRSYTIAHMQKFPFILANTCFTSPQLATNRRTQAENRFSLVFFQPWGLPNKTLEKRGEGSKIGQNLSTNRYKKLQTWRKGGF